MANWVPNLQFIENGERVEEDTVGRITRQLAQRTDYLFEVQNELVERKQRTQIDNIACSSAVENYTVVYLNPITKLLEPADGFDTEKTALFGIAINKRSAIGGFVCDIVVKGLLSIPAAELGTLVTEASWLDGDILFLDGGANAGKSTFVEPTLSIPIGITLPLQDGFYRLVVDGDPYLNLMHRHVREVFTMDIGSADYSLTFQPTLPSAVFAHVDGAVLRFDDDAVGTFLLPGDPDFTVVGTTLTVYTHLRFFINPDPPKLVVWYSTPFGFNGGVTGIVAGHNISLSSCSISGGIATGVVTINSVPAVKEVIDHTETDHVKKIEVDPSDFSLKVTTGRSVNKLSPGIGIYFTGDIDGQGEFTVNARANRNNFELVPPESIFLQNSKQDFLFDKFHAYVLEAGESEEAVIKFRVPEYASGTTAPKLRLEYMIGSQDPDNDVELSIGFQQLIDDSSLAQEVLTTGTQVISIAAADFGKRKTEEIDIALSLVPNSTLIFVVSRTNALLTDTYVGDFNVLHSRLRIVPLAI